MDIHMHVFAYDFIYKCTRIARCPYNAGQYGMIFHSTPGIGADHKGQTLGRDIGCLLWGFKNNARVLTVSHCTPNSQFFKDTGETKRISTGDTPEALEWIKMHGGFSDLKHGFGKTHQNSDSMSKYDIQIKICADYRDTVPKAKESLSGTQPVRDDVIKWKHYLRYWPFVRGIH